MIKCLSGFLAVTMLVGCSVSQNDSGAEAVSDLDSGKRIAELKGFFATANIVSEPEIVDCTLSEGEKSQCFSITVKPGPKNQKTGPWCPRRITDGPDKSGIWLDGGKVYDADGKFLSEMSEFYDDDNWQMVNPETGEIKVTNSKEKCAAAARPDVDEAYANYCVECQLEYMDDDATTTFVIPLTPVAADREGRTNQAGSGIAYNGVRLDGPAPTDAILGAYTIAPFDDCGGHINLHVGYHYHAVTQCLDDAPVSDDHGKTIGIAMDGYDIFSHLDSAGKASKDLDNCGGHLSSELGYHYHAGEAGSNAILGCLKAQNGCVLEGRKNSCDASVRRGPPPPNG